MTVAVESVQKREKEFTKKNRNKTAYLKAQEFAKKKRSPTAYLKTKEFIEKRRNQIT